MEDDRNNDGNVSKPKTVKGNLSVYICPLDANCSTKLDPNRLKKFLPDLIMENITETQNGFIVNNLVESYANKIIKLNLASALGTAVQALPLYSEQFKKIVCFDNIPSCITLEEIEHCLRLQNIRYANITRDETHTFIEPMDTFSYQRLKNEGINFYGTCTFFPLDPDERTSNLPPGDANRRPGNGNGNKSDIIQCYRCQGFWHTATNCRQNVRCVRCGDEHSVEQCARPKDDPVCCNCKGPHHAAYKKCPVRQSVRQGQRVQIMLTR